MEFYFLLLADVEVSGAEDRTVVREMEVVVFILCGEEAGLEQTFEPHLGGSERYAVLPSGAAMNIPFRGVELYYMSATS